MDAIPPGSLKVRLLREPQANPPPASRPRRRPWPWVATALLSAAAFVAGILLAAAAATSGPPLASMAPRSGTGPTLPPSDPGFSTPLDAASPSELFQSFDLDRDGRITVPEAVAFYDWVEHHIQYRYDDENATGTVRGWDVGDGRPGPDYQQTPQETLREGKGDCEDMNALELAFYTHWKIPAYLAYVNARLDGAIDHAITLVRAAGTLEEFRKILGNMTYYESKGRPGVADGYYFVVDNAYSDTFGTIPADIEPGRFVVHRTVSATVLFGMNWGPATA